MSEARGKRRWRAGLALALAVGCGVTGMRGQGAEDGSAEASEADEAARTASAAAALERVARDRETRSAQSAGRSEGIPMRRRWSMGTDDPVFRNGVPYYEEWTIRAGASRLRVPALDGWEAVRPESEFYQTQARRGEAGDHLALAMTNARFVRSSRSKYVNYFGLLWVPQEYAFLEMTPGSFGAFKDGLRERIVERRKATIDRDDFLAFEDYLDFKLGYDERVDEFVDGYLFLASETERSVIYFATSEFVYQSPRTEIRQPMIMTVAYALVEGKLLRIDFRRLYTQDEDAVQLIAFTQRFIDDMREVNGLSDYRRPYR